MNLTEFAPAAEHCTATFTSHTDTGENYEGPISVGVYTGDGQEIWVEFSGVRFNLNVSDVEPFIKQLRRAARIAGDKS